MFSLRNRRRSLALSLFAVVCMTAAAIFAGGCGGASDSDSSGGSVISRQKINTIGTLHGELADDLAQKANCVPYSGSTDAPLIVSLVEGNHGAELDSVAQKAIEATLMSGHAVGIMHADAEEVNLIRMAIGFPTSYETPASVDYVDFYGIKVISNDIFVYTSIPDATPYDAPIEPVVQDTIMLGEDNFVSSDKTQVDKPSKSKESNTDDLKLYGVYLSGDTLFYKGTHNEVKSSDVIFGNKMKSSSGGLEDITELTAGSADSYGEALDNKRQSLLAQDVIDWCFDTESQEQSAAAAKREASAQLAATSSADESKSVAFVARHEFNLSETGKSLRFFADIFTCHTFNEADGKDSDWILVKQSGMLNPSAGYVNKAPENDLSAKMSGYMVYYEFTNWLEDSKGTELKSTQASIQQASPNSTVGSAGVTAIDSYTFTGSIGYKSGSVSLGRTIGSSTTYTMPDIQVTANSGADAEYARTSWRYDFTRPTTTGWKLFRYNSFNDAPISARSLFQPVNQWGWKIGPASREKAKTLVMNIKWADGLSTGAGFVWGFKILDEKHSNRTTREKPIRIPIDTYLPPLIGANGLSFSAEGGYKKAEYATCRGWSVESDSTWCQPSMKYGNGMDEALYVTADKNNTGKNREANLTFELTDGSGTQCVMKVFQAKAPQ